MLVFSNFRQNSLDLDKTAHKVFCRVCIYFFTDSMSFNCDNIIVQLCLEFWKSCALEYRKPSTATLTINEDTDTMSHN